MKKSRGKDIRKILGSIKSVEEKKKQKLVDGKDIEPKASNTLEQTLQISKNDTTPSTSSKPLLSNPDKPKTCVEKQNIKGTQSHQPKSLRVVSAASVKSKIDILTKRLREQKKSLDISKTKDLKKCAKKTTNDPMLSNVEVVDISSDSDLEDDEFRRIFANVDTNLGFDASDVTDTEEISSGETSETSSCILLDDDSENSDDESENNARTSSQNTNKCDNLPVLPNRTTITLVRRKSVESKSSSTNKSRKKSKSIEVVDLE